MLPLAATFISNKLIVNSALRSKWYTGAKITTLLSSVVVSLEKVTASFPFQSALILNNQCLMK